MQVIVNIGLKSRIRGCLPPAYFGGKIAGIYSYTKVVCCS